MNMAFLVAASSVISFFGLGCGMQLTLKWPSARMGKADSACTPLRNRGSHYTAEIRVGTPDQTFDLVADTGSNNFIVSSCVCRKHHTCFPHSKCFTGSSSSLSIPGGKRPRVLVMNFGSGDIEAAVVTDNVSISSWMATMESSLLLMVDHHLRTQGPFEGILGLGVPNAGVLGPQRYPPGFLEVAEVERFSICFNEGADGVLRLNPPSANNLLGSVGQAHWGLDFRGISVGTFSASLFCSPVAMNHGQTTPCGAVPDSGTTLMMGPGDEVSKLFATVCEQWPRCKSAVPHLQRNKDEVFQIVLSECGTWWNDSTGFDDLPSLHLHVVGSDGNSDVLKIPGPAYVLAVEEEDIFLWDNHVTGTFAFHALSRSRRRQKVCIPAFGALDYTSVKNGPVWILGMPLFFEYQVGYDLRADPPAVGFSNHAVVAMLVRRCTRPGQVAPQDASRGTFEDPHGYRA